MQTIQSLSEIKDQYDTYLVDVVGVVWDGQHPIKDAITAINALVEDGKSVIFLSNNPRPSDGLYKKLVDNGVNPKAQALCSGDATVRYMEQNLPGKTAYHLGANRNDEILSKTDYATTKDITQSDFVLLTAYLNPEENISIYAEDLDWIIQHKPRVLCANPDVVAPMEGGQLRRTAGFIGNYLQQHGVLVDYMGKPSPMIYETAFNLFDLTSDNKSTCLMIGDTLETDVAGASEFGIDSLMVLTGNTGREIQESCHSTDVFVGTKPHKPTYVAANL